MADQLTRKDLVELLAASKQETAELFAVSKQETTKLLAVSKQETAELLAATEQRLIGILETKFAEERVYYRQLIQGELTDIRQQLTRIEQQIGGDATSALLEIDKLEKRVSELKQMVIKLQTA